MLQLSGVLETCSLQFQREALKLINATICGTTTTDLWKVLESFFGVDEDSDESTLEDAQSLAEVLKLHKEEKETSIPSIRKDVAESTPAPVVSSTANIPEDEEDIIVLDDEDIEVASVSSSQSPTLKTLAQKKKETVQKYPSACSLKEASLFYLTSLDTMHSTSINVAHFSDHMKIGPCKGNYRCAHPSGCDYAAQTYSIVTSHIHRVHKGAALSCRFCLTLAWWQARYWSEHMDKKHHDQPKY